MHELSIAASILDAVRAETARRSGARLLKIGLRLGELAGVDRDSLAFCFEAIVQDTEFAEATLEIEWCPQRNRCPECGRTFTVVCFEAACPACGARSTEPAGGDELDLAYLEFEEPCPTTTGT